MCMYVQHHRVNRKVLSLFYYFERCIFLFHYCTDVILLFLIENCTEKLSDILQRYLEKMIYPQSCHHRGDSI